MSDEDTMPMSAEPGRSAGVGPTLRARREQLGWALPDVATWLRIRLSYLEAMEDGRVHDLPGNVYALGFLRTYAQALGLDAEVLVTRFKGEARGSIDCKPELSFPAPVPSGAMPVGVMALLGGVVIIIAYVGWYRATGVQSVPPRQVPSVSSAIPGMTRQVATSPQVASVLPPERSALPPRPLSGAEKSAITAGDVSVPASPVPPVQAPPAQGVASAAPVPGAMPPAQAGIDPPASSPSPAVQAPARPATVPGQVSLVASAPTWVQVRIAGGHVLYDHVLQAGESWSAPPDQANLLLTVGNAGGLVLSVDGVTTQPLGRNGAVRRNLPLTSDAIRSGSIVESTQAAPVPRPAPSHGSAPIAAPATGQGGAAAPSASPAPGQ